MISLIHPSRGRPQKAFDTYNNWINKLSGDYDIEHILSIDNSDLPNNKQDYFDLFTPFTKIICSDNDCVVDATNQAAKLATGEILVYLSDDFDCPDNWDDLIYCALSMFKNRPMLLKVDDCLQPFQTKIVTIPIMNRELYNKLGYMWHPDYKSMFVDEDLYWTCSIRWWVTMCPDLKFPHNHYLNGKAEQDDTYKRSESFWNQGKELFAKRKQLQFPL